MHVLNVPAIYFQLKKQVSYSSLGRLGVRWWVFLGTSYGANSLGKQNHVPYFHLFFVFCFLFGGI